MHTNQSLSSTITRAGTAHFSFNEFDASARKEFFSARQYDPTGAVDRARELAKVLERNAIDHGKPIDALQDAARLVGLAEGVNALACLTCNGIQRRQLTSYGKPYVGGSWNDEDEKAEQTKRAVLVADMNAILAMYDARVVASYGDPRGSVIHIQFPDNSSNRGSNETVWGL